MGALRRIGTVYRVEITKAVRLKWSYVGPALVVVTVIGASFVRPVERDSVSDYDFIAYATTVSLNLVGMFFVLMYGAGLISSELSRGTARLAFVRPVLRREWLAAKTLLGVTYAAALVVCAAGATWLITVLFGEAEGVSFGGDIVHTGLDMSKTYLIALVLHLVPLFTAVAYAIMVSSLTRSTASAIGGAVGIWLVVDIVKHPLGAAPFVFSTYLERPWQVFLDRADGLSRAWAPDVYYTVGVSAAWFALFMVVSGLVLSRRNIGA